MNTPIILRVIISVLMIIGTPFFKGHLQAQQSATLPAVSALAGNHETTGHYTLRLTLPAGYSSAPHFYTSDYYITVLKGSLQIGYGENVRGAKMSSFEEGSFLLIPAQQIFFEKTDEETLLQIHGIAPVHNETKNLTKGRGEPLQPIYHHLMDSTLSTKITKLHGDISKEMYGLRLRMPAGKKLAPHRHPLDQYVTVLKGKLLIGYGKDFDLTKADTINTGDFLLIDAHKIHYELFPEETIVQIHGPGPLKTEMISSGPSKD